MLVAIKQNSLDLIEGLCCFLFAVCILFLLIVDTIDYCSTYLVVQVLMFLRLGYSLGYFGIFWDDCLKRENNTIKFPVSSTARFLFQSRA
jgi:hypothetical protein